MTVPYLNTSDVERLLATRYSGKEWVYLSQVRNGTGFSRRVNRTADGIAMSVWPSRGLHLHGFEIKVDRADWLKEKSSPEKAEEICRFCDFWWLVVSDPKIVRDDELPAPWGLLVPDDSGKKLVQKKQPEKLDPQPMDRLMLASILRTVAEETVPRACIAKQIEDARKAGEKTGTEIRKCDLENAQKELRDLRKKLHDFETVSGITIDRWTYGNQGAAVKALLEMSDRTRWANEMADKVRRVLESLTAFAEIAGEPTIRVVKDKGGPYGDG